MIYTIGELRAAMITEVYRFARAAGVSFVANPDLLHVGCAERICTAWFEAEAQRHGIGNSKPWIISAADLTRGTVPEELAEIVASGTATLAIWKIRNYEINGNPLEFAQDLLEFVPNLPGPAVWSRHPMPGNLTGRLVVAWLEAR